MLRIRVIPCLLLKNSGLVKTVRFKNPKYVGDPINAVRIFNEKEVDELIFLDTTATAGNRKPNFRLIWVLRR
jgi:cyclase